VLTPLLAFQGDVDYVRASSASLAAIQELAANPDIHPSEDMRSSFARYMATAGLEMSWPLLFSLASGSSHVVEPMAQVFLRPNEQYVGGLSIP
ncbi:LPS assembly protein LptD, partial [Mesorhizobium sp. M4B.F.Ca.ET.214.01.1.1]